MEAFVKARMEKYHPGLSQKRALIDGEVKVWQLLQAHVTDFSRHGGSCKVRQLDRARPPDLRSHVSVDTFHAGAIEAKPVIIHKVN